MECKIFLLFAASIEIQLLVSPRTNTASGLISDNNLSVAMRILPIVWHAFSPELFK